MLLSNVGRIVELGGGFAFFANDDDTKAATLEGSTSKKADVTTRTKVDSVSGGDWEVARGDPVNGRGEDLVTQGRSDRSGQLAKIRS